MRVRVLFAAAFLVVLFQAPAWGGRPVTEEERAKLVTALAAEGCSGGEMNSMGNTRLKKPFAGMAKNTISFLTPTSSSLARSLMMTRNSGGFSYSSTAVIGITTR